MAWSGDSNPHALYKEFCERLNQIGPAYLNVVEPRISGVDTIEPDQGPVASEELRQVFDGNILSGGGYNPDTAETAVSGGVATMVAFGRHFIANPDLPKRIELDLPLNHYDEVLSMVVAPVVTLTIRLSPNNSKL